MLLKCQVCHFGFNLRATFIHGKMRFSASALEGDGAYHVRWCMGYGSVVFYSTCLSVEGKSFAFGVDWGLSGERESSLCSLLSIVGTYVCQCTYHAHQMFSGTGCLSCDDIPLTSLIICGLAAYHPSYSINETNQAVKYCTIHATRK